MARQPSTSSISQAQKILAEVFGFHQFRSHQAEIIRSAVDGGDVLALMPTGGGKSLCYQVPSLVRPGTGIVVSPLIALMQDQVDALTELGVKAAFLNSTLDWQDQLDVEARLRAGTLDLLYIAPERLLQERVLNLLNDAHLALFAIDEAHCVSQWGHDFRPEYRQLKILAERFPSVPRMALTATADLRTREEIAHELCLDQAQRFVASFDRPNIRYTISMGGSMGARERLWSFISAEHEDDSGIVYCLSRKSVEETAAWISRKGRVALAYHAGMDADVRRSVLERFRKEPGIIVVATIAFGMGIDKPDVRFVAHLNLPKSIEAYYQETGRAGRDGAPANAWMSYGLQDLVQLRQWIERSDGSEAYKKTQRQKLDALIGLCELPTCRRQALLAYFSEDLEEPCGNCDNCIDPPQTLDGSLLAQKALSAVYRTGQRFGVGYLIDVLRGQETERIIRNRHDQLKVFGLGRDTDEAVWKAVMRQLVAEGHLTIDQEGYGTLLLTERSRPLLRGEQVFRMREVRKDEPRKKQKRGARSGSALTVLEKDRLLFDELKRLRLSLASKAKLPPYIICTDVTLSELAHIRPSDRDGLQSITGLGTSKIARYGDAFLETIAGHKSDDSISVPTGNVPVPTNRLSKTVNATLALHLQGHDVERISEIRGVGLSTIYDHLAEAVEAGLVEARTAVGLGEEEIDHVLAAFEDTGTVETGKLGAAHAALEGRYDYGVLKCILAELA